MTLRSLFGRTASTLLMLSLAACGGGGGDSPPATFTIGGTVAGLASGAQVVLNNNGNPSLTVSADGTFTFTQPVSANGSYLVTINTQPTGQTCSVANFQGAGVTANVAIVNVTCVTSTFTIGGTVTGLAAGQQVTFNDNGGDPKTVTANGAFAFSTPVAFNGVYAVTVGTQPTGQTCTVGSGSGSGVVANITSVAVTCSANTFTIGGTVTGLAAGQQVILNNNGSNPKTVTANGAFTFSTPVAFNSVYAVTVGTQPTGKTCTVGSGSGSGVVANIANVTVTCSTNTFTIGGTVTGLAAGQQVTLNNNGSDPKTVNANGAFTFSTPVTFNGVYAVTVGTQPTGKTCTVVSGSGAGVVANITNVTVTCSTNTFTIGGTVTGLTAGQQVTLNNNGSNPKTVTANGAFTFSTPVTFNGVYAVTVGTQPTGQTCTVGSGSGSGVVANITSVAVTCSTNTFTIGGTVTGLAAGQQVTLDNNGSDPKIVSANGAFTFATPVAFNGVYAVTVGTQPTGQTCTVGSGSGAGVVANITSVTVTCSTNTFTIGGTVTGLAAGQQVTLNNNGSDPKIVTADGSFTFATPVTFNGSYDVTVGTQPTAETCRVANGTGSTVNSNVTSVSISCRLAIAYVTNALDSTISQYRIGLDGALTSFGTPIATGHTPNKITVDPTGRFAYAANFGDDPFTGGIQGTTVSQYTIGADGTLTPNGTAATGLNPYSVAIDSTGQYAYVTSQSSDAVSQFTVGANGVLTPMGTPSVPSGHLPYGLTIDPTGRYVYVANFGNSITKGTTVSQYTIGAGGALVPMTPATVTTGSGPISVTVNPAGTYAYVTNFFDLTVSQFSIDGTGGLVPSGPTVPTGNGPYPITIAPNGQYAYWSNKYDDTIAQCTFATGGALDCSAGTVATSFSPGARPQYIAVDPFGAHLYAVNNSNGAAGSISQYTIGAGGVLTLIGGAAPTTGLGPFSIATTR